MAYFKPSIIFLVSSKLNPLRVVIRTFPKAPVESETDIAASSLGNSALITMSNLPNVYNMSVNFPPFFSKYDLKDSVRFVVSLRSWDLDLSILQVIRISHLKH